MATAQQNPANGQSVRGFLRFIHFIFGEIRHTEISFSEFDTRIRARYQSSIDELSRLGFEYLCSDAESFSLFRLFLVIPALVILGMKAERFPMEVRGLSILVGYPVLISRDRSTLANPDGKNVKFFSTFRDGTMLVSGNYDDPTTRGPGIVRAFGKASIPEAWERHQAKIQELEAGANRVDRQGSHESYAAMQRRDTATW